MSSELSVIMGEMKQRLEEYDRLLEKFGTFERAMTAENVIHCGECAFYHPETLLCDRYGLEKPMLMIEQGYCSCGIDRETFDKMMEHCRANGGWCTPGVILTSDEITNLLGCKEEK